MDSDQPSGQDSALLSEIMSRVNKLELESKSNVEAIKKRDEQIDELMKKLREKDQQIEDMKKKMDEYAKEIEQLKKGKPKEVKTKEKTILESIMRCIKKHPIIVVTAVSAGIIVGFLSFYGIPVVAPVVFGKTAAITCKAAVACGCVAGGSTLLIGDVVASDMGKTE